MALKLLDIYMQIIKPKTKTLDLNIIAYTIVNSKWIKYLNVKHKTTL